MRPLRRIAFVAKEIRVGSPGQQLLDRFLVGYNLSGVFHAPGCRVTIAGVDRNAELAARARDFGLELSDSVKEAVGGADGVVLVPRGGELAPGSGELEAVMEAMPRGGRCFVSGFIASDGRSARERIGLARGLGVELGAGNAAGTAFPLPEIRLPERGRVRRALVTAHGPFPEAEGDALAAVIAWAGRHGAAGEVSRVTRFVDREVWRTAYSEEWGRLLEAAVSRSHTIQGDAVRDGRTQDVVGSRKIERLAPSPRGWIIEHRDGMRTALLVLNGALEDLNIAFDLGDQGGIVSAQLYRPPPPMEDHYSGLAHRIERFLRVDVPDAHEEALVFGPSALGMMGS